MDDDLNSLAPPSLADAIHPLINAIRLKISWKKKKNFDGHNSDVFLLWLNFTTMKWVLPTRFFQHASCPNALLKLNEAEANKWKLSPLR